MKTPGVNLITKKEVWLRILEALCLLHSTTNSAKGSLGVEKDTNEIYDRLNEKIN
jgi:hypothetical protein